MIEYIDRNALKKSIGESTEPFTVSMVYRNINHAPAADVAPVVHAHWIADKDSKRCSNCGCCQGKNFLFEHNYCSYCGAKMDGGLL